VALVYEITKQPPGGERGELLLLLLLHCCPSLAIPPPVTFALANPPVAGRGSMEQDYLEAGATGILNAEPTQSISLQLAIWFSVHSRSGSKPNSAAI
jgi:hypothetical protein